MIWKSATHQPLTTLACTGFLVSVTSYLVFWVIDLLIPGFVSRYFSVHVFLLAALVFGTLWSHGLKQYEERAWMHRVVALLFGILGSVIAWKAGEMLYGYRLITSVVALLTPLLILQLIKD
ncbi:hypothetical protein HZA87_04550 [Candidatus Uhrbacteria bacterium]|nr:hypothetical protein [Candidatus Uhrbacteria bacterium]